MKVKDLKTGQRALLTGLRWKVCKEFAPYGKLCKVLNERHHQSLYIDGDAECKPIITVNS